jgi:pilus assembly protein CpaE
MQEVTLGLMLSDPELSAQVLGSLGELPVRVVMEIPDVAGAGEDFIDSELRRSTPDVVILEIAAAGKRFPAWIRLIKNRPSAPAVVALHAEADPEIILNAVRAGANDCLYPPIDGPVLRQMLERVAAERELRKPRRPPANTIGFLSATGGCGGTTLACHFAAELGRISGNSILLADFDVVAGMVGFWMRAGNGYSIRDAVRGLQRLDLSLWHGLVSKVQPELHVVSAPSEILAEDGCGPEQLLRIMRFARGHYDWVIADLGASLTGTSLRLLGELNTLFLVSTAEVGALYQTRRVLLKLLTLDYPQERVRLVLNRLHKQQQIRPAEVEEALGWRLEAVLPNDVQEIERAHGEGRLVSPKSDLGKRIAQLAAKTAGQQPAQEGSLWSALFRPSEAKGA